MEEANQSQSVTWSTFERMRNRDGVGRSPAVGGIRITGPVKRRRTENHMGHCGSIDRKNIGTRERVPKLISLAEKRTLPPRARVSARPWSGRDRQIGARKRAKREEISRPRGNKAEMGIKRRSARVEKADSFDLITRRRGGERRKGPGWSFLDAPLCALSGT